MPVKLRNRRSTLLREMGSPAEQYHAPPCSSLHHQFSFPLAKGIREVILIVLDDHVVEERLTAILVYPLGDLVACCVAKTWEEGKEFPSEGGGCVLSEDNGGKG